MSASPPDSSASNTLLPPPTASTSTEPQITLSKNAQKRLARQQAWDAEKPLRRAKERAMKKEKAAEKRKLVELGVIEKPVSKKLAKQGMKTPFNATIVIDLGFDDLMSEKEIKSMSSQLAFCYAANRLSAAPVPILITSLNGQMKKRLDSVQKTYENWRGIEWWEESYEKLWNYPGGSGEEVVSPTEEPLPPPPVDLGVFKGRPRARTARSSVVYLTSDSSNILTEFEEGTTYVLGGLVDHNRYKSLCFDKAEKQGIRHAQLPISQYLPEMLSRRVLTVNQVFEIIVKWTELRDWEAALRAVMPTRKFLDGGKRGKKAQGEGEGEDDGEEEESEEEVEESEVYIAQDD